MSYKKFTKDIGILGLTQLITAIAGILELSIITKLLGAENYGIWTQLTITITLVTPIIVLGLPYTLVRFLAGEKNEKEIQDGFWSVTAIILVFSLIISFLLILFSSAIARLFGCDKIFIFILALIIVFECLNQLQFNFFRVFQEIKKYSLFTILRNIVKTGLIVLTVFFGFGLMGAILSVLFARFIFFLIMSPLIIKRIRFKIPRFLRTKEYLSFSVPPIFGDISFWFIQSSDKYLVGFFLGTLFVGYYAPAYMIGCILSFFISPLSFLLPVTLSKHYDENKIDDVKTYLRYSLKYFLLIAIPSFFGISILSKQLLTIFSTPEIAKQSYQIIPFIALSMLLAGISVIFDQALTLKKKTYIGGAVWLLAALINFGMNLIFIPRFGILGAGITTLLAYIFIFLITWHYSFKELRFEIDWYFVFKSVFSAILMSLFVIWLKPIGLYKTLVAIALGALLYAFCLFLVKGFGRTEIRFLKILFKEVKL